MSNVYSLADTKVVLSHPKVGTANLHLCGTGKVVITASGDLSSHTTTADGYVVVNKLKSVNGMVTVEVPQNSIGDTFCLPKKNFRYEGIPTFAPEHFARVRQVDTMKRDQFVKGITQIAQEGAIQIFQEYNTGMEEIITGVVGMLQFDVLKFRLKSEYNVDIILETLPYEHIRWIVNKDIDPMKIVGTTDMKRIRDLKGNPLLLFINPWSVGMVLDRNEGLVLEEFSRN